MAEKPRQLVSSMDGVWLPGSEPGLETVLRLAKKHDLPIVAFVTGRLAEGNPGLIRDRTRGGCEVGPHRWRHGFDRNENFRRALTVSRGSFSSRRSGL